MTQKQPLTKTKPAKADLAPGPRTVTLLGATGSIGTSTADLLRRDRAGYQVEAVTAYREAGALARLARELGARFAAVADPAFYDELKSELSGSGIEAAAGPGALVEAAQRPADWVMAAITGAASLAPTLAAAERGATVAIANKECLVCAGALFMRLAAAKGATVLPVDSEHNAIFQALGAGRREDVSRIVLTASGGPFRTLPLEAIRKVTVEQALKHPTWQMGPKVTIDSATLMNKGLELIEAHHLFALAPDMLDVVVHPQSIIHGLVEFRDGSVIAQLGSPDMRIPISHCLAWPVRMEHPGGTARSCPDCVADLRGTGPDPLPGAGARAPGACGRRGGADHSERGQRNRGPRIHWPKSRIYRHCGARRGHFGRHGAPRRDGRAAIGRGGARR